ncbi:hypothetical protein [Pedobacter rhodius]|uniref:Uncharacterized protein n=1 Tax=Pedobacter rhodius TaxID=3004098 RepID=A0ABT4KX28_9SPHI|nr:hypothetical protein [Pedobacter sp. SJ11]MCZ4223494.1 hypothetical protein [Pedobacter sp. SJ11]
MESIKEFKSDRNGYIQFWNYPNFNEEFKIAKKKYYKNKYGTDDLLNLFGEPRVYDWQIPNNP